MKPWKKAILFGSLILCTNTCWSTTQAMAVENDVQHPAAKIKYGSVKLTFSVVSDIHLRCGVNDRGAPYRDVQAEQKFARALQDLHQIDANQSALVINGDLTTTGMQSDYDCMHKVLHQYSHATNMLFAIGNHEFYSAFYRKDGRLSLKTFPNGMTDARCIQRFLHNTGMPNVYYDRWIHGYHFIVLGSEQSRITRRQNQDSAILSDIQLQWLDERLRNSPSTQPIFVFLHQPMPNTVAGSVNGYIVNADKLRRVLNKYPQVIFFSGHSHRTLVGQSRTMVRDGMTMLNDSSVSNPVLPNRRPSGGSEGLYVQVYQDKIVVRGRDFTRKAWIHQYVVPVAHEGVHE